MDRRNFLALLGLSAITAKLAPNALSPPQDLYDLDDPTFKSYTPDSYLSMPTGWQATYTVKKPFAFLDAAFESGECTEIAFESSNGKTYIDDVRVAAIDHLFGEATTYHLAGMGSLVLNA